MLLLLLPCSLSLCLSLSSLAVYPVTTARPSEPHKETFVPTLVEWSLVSEVVKEIQEDRTSKQSQHKSPGPEAPLCLSRPGNECPLVLITLRAHTGDMTDSIVLCVFNVARGHSLTVNIGFALPPPLPPGDQRTVCTGLAGRAHFLVCVFSVTPPHYNKKKKVFICVVNHYKTFQKNTVDCLSVFWPD